MGARHSAPGCCCCCCCDIKSGWRSQVAAIRLQRLTHAASQQPAAGMARSSWRPQPAPWAMRRPPVPQPDVSMTSRISGVLPDAAGLSKRVSAACAKSGGKCASGSVPGNRAAAASLQGGAPGSQAGGRGACVVSRLPECAKWLGRGRCFWAGSRWWRCGDTSPCRPRRGLPAPRCAGGCSRDQCPCLSTLLTCLLCDT